MLRRKYKVVNLGEDRFIIQEDETLFGFIWMSTGWVTSTTNNLNKINKKKVCLEENERVRFERQVLIFSLIIISILTYLIAK